MPGDREDGAVLAERRPVWTKLFPNRETLSHSLNFGRAHHPPTRQLEGGKINPLPALIFHLGSANNVTIILALQ